LQHSEPALQRNGIVMQQNALALRHIGELRGIVSVHCRKVSLRCGTVSFPGGKQASAGHCHETLRQIAGLCSAATACSRLTSGRCGKICGFEGPVVCGVRAERYFAAKSARSHNPELDLLLLQEAPGLGSLQSGQDGEGAGFEAGVAVKIMRGTAG
jgi:hypothetical protein